MSVKTSDQNNTKHTQTEKPKGQVLLFVLIIGTLVMLLMVGLAGRIATTRTDIARTAEFDRSVSFIDNAVNIVAGKVTTDQACANDLASKVKSDRDYVLVGGGGGVTCIDKALGLGNNGTANPGSAVLDDLVSTNTVKVFAKKKPGETVITPSQPVSVFTSNLREKSISQIVFDINETPSTNGRVMITLISGAGATEPFKVYKQIASFKKSSKSLSFDINKFREAPGPGKNGTLSLNSIPKIVSMRIRLMDGVESLNIYAAAKSGASTVMATEGSYDMIVTGSAGLDSDAIAQFNLNINAARDGVPALFDFVYFGEDTD